MWSFGFIGYQKYNLIFSMQASTVLAKSLIFGTYGK